MVEGKVCKACNEFKSFEEFKKHPIEPKYTKKCKTCLVKDKKPTGKFGHAAKCKECPHCKTSFLVTSGRKYCSEDCRKQYTREEASRKYQENKEEISEKNKIKYENSKTIEKTCEYCQNTFLTCRKNGRFCNNSCVTSWKNKNGLGAGTKRKTESGERFTKMIEENGHKQLSPYKGWKYKVLIDFGCKEHGAQWKNAKDYQDGYIGCPGCSRSKGEAIIEKELVQRCLTFESEYTFPDTSWRYDFILPFDNIIIEVHGAQHYEEVRKFQRSLSEEQENDRQKKEYAESLGYKYIVIDYREHKPNLALKRFKKQFEYIA